MGGRGRLPMSLFPRAWEQGGTSHSTILATGTAHLSLPGPRPGNSELGCSWGTGAGQSPGFSHIPLGCLGFCSPPLVLESVCGQPCEEMGKLGVTGGS